MNLIIDYFYVIFIVCIISCQPEGNNDNKDITTIPIPEETTGLLNVYEYFEAVRIIPLETTDQSILGRIKKIVIANGKIIILDDQRKRLQIFDKEGKHLESIDKMGLGPGELMSPIDFIVTDGTILIYDSQNGLIKYNIEGDFIFQEKDPFNDVPTQSFFDILSFQSIKDSLYLFRREVPGNGIDSEHGKKLYIGDFTNLRDSFLTYSSNNFTNHNTTYTNYFSMFNTGYNYWEIFLDTLFYLDFEEMKLSRKYFFDFGKRSLSNKIAQIPLSAILEHLKEHGSSYSGMIRNFVEFEDFIFFNYTKNIVNEGAIPQFAVLNKESDNVETYDGLSLDSGGLEFKELQFKLSDSTALAIIESLELSENKNNSKLLDENLKSRKTSDNPVLILMTK